jgi:hypothetical protein
MRALPLAGLTLLLALGCRDAGPEPVSPFTFFARDDMRAGVTYAAMDDAAKRESIGQFVCKDLWAGGKRCQAQIDPGMLIATVDGKGRVVHLMISTEAKMRGSQWDPRTQARVDFAKSEFTRMREAWSLVSEPEVTAWARGTAKFRWIDDQSRWSAGMWYGSLYTYLPANWQQSMAKYQDTLAYLPDSVVTADEIGLEAYMALQPADAAGRTAQKGPPSDPFERMQFDLTMVASAQSEYFEDHATFATSADALIFLAGEGVRIEIKDATRAGWAAIATHDALPGTTCVLYSGSVASPPRTPKGVAPTADAIACDAG